MLPKEINFKTLILSLIKNDLIHSRLVTIAQQSRNDAEDYASNLSDLVFQLMGFDDSPENEAVFDHYYKLCNRTKLISLRDCPHKLDQLAEDIYGYLELRIPESQKS